MGDPALVGSWKMLSCFMEDILTGERSAILGEHPNGYIVLTANARCIVGKRRKKKRLHRLMKIERQHSRTVLFAGVNRQSASSAF